MTEVSEIGLDWSSRLALPGIFDLIEERVRGRMVGHHLQHERLLKAAARLPEGVKAITDRLREESQIQNLLADKAFALSTLLAEEQNIEAKVLGVELVFSLVKILETKVPDEDKDFLMHGLLPPARRVNPEVYQWLSKLPVLLQKLLAPPPDRELVKPEKYPSFIKKMLRSQEGQSPELVEMLARIIYINSFARFARAFAGEHHDSFSIMDYIADFSFTEEDSSLIRETVIPHLFKANKAHPLFLFLFRRAHGDEDVQGPSKEDFNAALCDPHHPKRQQVRQIVLKMASWMDVSKELLPLLLSRVGGQVTPFKGERKDLEKIATHPNAKQVIEGWLPELEFVFGPGMKKMLVQFEAYMKGYVPIPTSPKPRPNLGLVEEFKDGRSYKELVEKIPGVALLEKIDMLDVDPDMESLSEAREVTERFKKDILESQIALQSFRMGLGNMNVSFQPVEPFPAHKIGVRRGDYFHQYYLNERLELESPGETLGVKGEILEAILVAGLHDFHPFHQVVPVENKPKATGSARSPQSRPEGESTPRPHQPSRVLHGNNLLVISDQPIDQEHTAMVISKGNGNVMKVHIDRRPHWTDIVPAITRQARQWTWQELESVEPLVGIDPIARKMLSVALSHPDAHRLTTRKIFEDIIYSRRGKEIFPTNFPLDELIQRFEEVEHQYASELQAEYEDLPIIPVGGLSVEDYQQRLAGRKKKGPLPRIFSIAQRKQADKQRMHKEGVEYVVPDRMRSTQTYIPFERFTLEIPAGDQKKLQHIKNYIIAPGATAIEVLINILHLKAQS